MSCNTSRPLAPLVAVADDADTDSVLYAAPDIAVRVFTLLQARGPLSRRAIALQLRRPLATAQRAVRALTELEAVTEIERPAGEA